jgi:hypothetical protein
VHDGIGLIDAVELAVGLQLVGEDRVVVFGRGLSASFVGELLRVLDDCVPLAEAEGGVGEETQDAGFELGVLMVEFSV